MKIKVKVGQVWADGVSSLRYTISAIRDNFAFYIRDGQEQERGFARVDEDGAPDWPCHPDGWHVVDEGHSQSSSSSADDDLSFFRSVSTPGNCVCNIPREDCIYHRD